MANKTNTVALNIRRFPPDLMASLKKQAGNAGMSLKDYVVKRLSGLPVPSDLNTLTQEEKKSVEWTDDKVSRAARKAPSLPSRKPAKREKKTGTTVEEKVAATTTATIKPCPHGLTYHPGCTG